MIQAPQHTRRLSRADGSTAVIADAHPLWLLAVEGVLDDLGVVTVGATTVPAEAAELIESCQPDILITDLEFGADDEPDGAEFVRRALELKSGLRVIVLTDREDSSTVADTIAAGASVYVVKTVTPDDLAAAVRQMFDHSVYFAPRKTPDFTRSGVVEDPHEPRSVIHRLDLADSSATNLTKREREILDLLSEGLPNAEIGRRLWITEQTVKFHLSNIDRKLVVSNRTQASRWTHRHPRDQKPAVGA